LSESWYPGWKAFVDQEEQAIIPADFAFRAIWIGKGVERVELRYQPASFETGLFASIAATVMLIIFLFGRRFRIFLEEQ
jgi:uncharacterized membrane protein YfhO